MREVMLGFSASQTCRINRAADVLICEVEAAVLHPSLPVGHPRSGEVFDDQDRMTAVLAAGFLIERLKQVMKPHIAIASVAAAVAQRATENPQAIDEILSAINVDARELFACSRQDVARFRTLQDIADSLAGMKTDSELQDEADGMSGDDAVGALSTLINWGREVSHEGPGPVAPFHAAWMKTVEHVKAQDESFPFKADVPGHTPPDDGAL